MAWIVLWRTSYTRARTRSASLTLSLPLCLCVCDPLWLSLPLSLPLCASVCPSHRVCMCIHNQVSIVFADGEEVFTRKDDSDVEIETQLIARLAELHAEVIDGKRGLRTPALPTPSASASTATAATAAAATQAKAMDTR